MGTLILKIKLNVVIKEANKQVLIVEAFSGTFDINRDDINDDINCVNVSGKFQIFLSTTNKLLMLTTTLWTLDEPYVLLL